jgi:hypothetical protein
MRFTCFFCSFFVHVICLLVTFLFIYLIVPYLFNIRYLRSTRRSDVLPRYGALYTDMLYALLNSPEDVSPAAAVRSAAEALAAKVCACVCVCVCVCVCGGGGCLPMSLTPPPHTHTTHTHPHVNIIITRAAEDPSAEARCGAPWEHQPHDSVLHGQRSPCRSHHPPQVRRRSSNVSFRLCERWWRERRTVRLLHAYAYNIHITHAHTR